MIIHSDNGKHFLIDCGSDARHSMHALGFNHRDVDGVYISHLHADHAGGLEWLGFTSRFDSQPRKPKLFVHPKLVKRLWEHVLSGGLQSLEGSRPARLSDYYQISPLADERFFTWEGIEFELIKTIHVNNGPVVAPSYGLYFTTAQTQVFITTDTQFQPELYNLYFEKADIIFHDCDTGERKSAVHAHFSELATLPESIKAKMWLYHYSHLVKNFNSIEQGFCGFVQKGQSFDI
jgi:ribonuclease BN (tRNA processing enzyme)